MPEEYIRPPLVGLEPPARWRAVWRFRIVALAVAVGLVVLVVLGYQKLTGAGNESPQLASLSYVHPA
ncbi:MAG: hypothetical protein M3N21_08080 [Actinomycetota bacterium]|nr:hypothetical protein [Actinomycetota bacterium]